MAVQLRAAEGESGRYAVVTDAGAVGWLRLEAADGRAALSLALVGAAPWGPADLAGALAAGRALAASAGVATTVLDAGEPLLRHEARAVGFSGGLHQPLEASGPDGPAPAAPAPGAAGLVAAAGALGVTLAPARRPGPAALVGRRLARGVGPSLDLVVDQPGARPVRLSVPDRADVMPEAVALAAAVIRSVRTRFPAHAGSVRSVSFDRSGWGLVSGRHLGEASGGPGAISLHVAYVVAEEAAGMLHRRAGYVTLERAAAATEVEGTVAHELWHQLEADMLAVDHRRLVAVRAATGAALGVETLEQALKGDRADAPGAWRTARARLEQQVSPYAATAVGEATAELFRRWWCGLRSPAVDAFGAALDAAFPPTGR